MPAFQILPENTLKESARDRVVSQIRVRNAHTSFTLIWIVNCKSQSANVEGYTDEEFQYEEGYFHFCKQSRVEITLPNSIVIMGTGFDACLKHPEQKAVLSEFGNYSREGLREE